MKNVHCGKCDDNRRKAGEALGLFNEALGTLLDHDGLLLRIESMMVDMADRSELSDDELTLLAEVKEARRAALERETERAKVGEVERGQRGGLEGHPEPATA